MGITMKFTAIPALALTTILACSVAASAASPTGTWLRPETGGQFRVFKCSGGLGIKVAKSKTAAYVGKTIMCGAKKTKGKDEWRGKVKNLEDGNTYSGIVTLSGGSLTLEGCALAGLICKKQRWRRLK